MTAKLLRREHTLVQLIESSGTWLTEVMSQRDIVPETPQLRPPFWELVCSSAVPHSGLEVALTLAWTLPQRVHHGPDLHPLPRLFSRIREIHCFCSRPATRNERRVQWSTRRELNVHNFAFASSSSGGMSLTGLYGTPR